MRRKALESDIIIVNHHLFFADLAIKQQARTAPDAGILPEAAAVIFDEAHELEDVASSYFGVGLSNVRFEELVRDTETLLRAKITIATSVLSAAQTAARAGADVLCRAAAGVRRARSLFAARGVSGELRAISIWRCGTRCTGWRGSWSGCAAWMRRRDCASVWRDIREHLKFLLESDVEQHRVLAGAAGAAGRRCARGRCANTYLQATPIDVSELLQRAAVRELFRRWC